MLIAEYICFRIVLFYLHRCVDNKYYYVNNIQSESAHPSFEPKINILLSYKIIVVVSKIKYKNILVLFSIILYKLT